MITLKQLFEETKVLNNTFAIYGIDDIDTRYYSSDLIDSEYDLVEYKVVDIQADYDTSLIVLVEKIK